MVLNSFSRLLLICLSMQRVVAFFYQPTKCHNENNPTTYNHPYPPYFQECFVRNEIIEIVNNLNFTIGAEIGVQRGIYSEVTLNLWSKAKRYYLVDIWKQQSKYYAETGNVPDAMQDQNYLQTKTRMEKFGDIPVLIRNASVDAAKTFPDEFFDYIYIDARHDYCGVREDLEAWYPKLKVGGLMAGHDFLHASEALSMSRGSANFFYCINGTHHPGAVKQAVDEFACQHKLTVLVSKEKPPSWYFSRKPPKSEK